MKIKTVSVNNRKKSLEIKIRKGKLTLPFSRLRLKPASDDKIIDAYVDKELDNRAVTYKLASGKEDSVHLDAFLDYNRDIDFMRQVILHKLTVQSVHLVKKSGLSKHEIIRRLKTSPSQLYRLLDPSNHRKSIGEMIKLLAILGYSIEFKVKKAA